MVHEEDWGKNHYAHATPCIMIYIVLYMSLLLLWENSQKRCQDCSCGGYDNYSDYNEIPVSIQ